MKPNWFVAFPIPARDWLDPVLHTLPESCSGFHPDDAHMTLAFFGAMDPGLEKQVRKVMDGIEAKAFTIQLGPLLALPAPKRVSALAFSVGQGGDTACDLISRYRGPLIEAASSRPDHRPPLAHITVARPLRKHGAAGKRAALEWAARTPPPNNILTVDRLALYTWSEDRKIRKFHIVHERPLSG